MATQYAQSAATPDALPQASAGKRYLIGPVADFLCFGGSSLIILPLLLLVPAAAYQAQIAAATFLIAHFVNNPHFAHSYQIFYRGFRAKASRESALQARYLFAGLVVPALLIAYFVFCAVTRNLQALAYAGNAMTLFVGWHYVKQGYGLLMVDATLKRRFFTAAEKKVLLVNSYAVWIAAWVAINRAIAENQLWGITSYAFDIPAPFALATAAAALATSVVTAWMLLSRWRAARALPANGVIAYGVSLYPWLLFININPLWFLLVPVLHSLQYLAVVWRFQLNCEKDRLAEPGYKAGSISRQLFGGSPAGHFALFVLSGIVLGYAGFTFFPVLLGNLIPYDKAVFGGGLFLFAALIFINVHHYFIDNVIWRRENPDAKRYLFS